MKPGNVVFFLGRLHPLTITKDRGDGNYNVLEHDSPVAGQSLRPLTALDLALTLGAPLNLTRLQEYRASSLRRHERAASVMEAVQPLGAYEKGSYRAILLYKAVKNTALKEAISSIASVLADTDRAPFANGEVVRVARSKSGHGMAIGTQLTVRAANDNKLVNFHETSAGAGADDLDIVDPLDRVSNLEELALYLKAATDRFHLIDNLHTCASALNRPQLSLRDLKAIEANSISTTGGLSFADRIDRIAGVIG